MNPLQPLIDVCEQAKSAMVRATTLIHTFPARVAAAVAAANVGGATGQQVADAVTAEVATMQADIAALNTESDANTPAPPAP